MGLLILGGVVLLSALGIFLYCLPRGGKTHRLVGTEFEPYVAVAIVAGLAVSFVLMLSGVIELVEAR